MLHPTHVAHYLSDAPDAWKYPPIGVEISPTNDCNAKCPWCFYVGSEYKKHHSKEELNRGVAHSLIHSLWCMGVKSITWTGGGDPSVYTRIDEVMRHAHEVNISQGMFTNAYRAVQHPEWLDWVRITITERFVLTKNVQAYVDAGTEVGVNFNCTKDNQGELRRLIEQAIEMGVKYFQVRPALADTFVEQRQVPFPDLVWEYEHDIKIEATPYKWADYMSPHGYDTCVGHRLVPFIWHDGTVSVCAYHNQDPRYAFGNLSEATFEQIWGSKRRRKMIEDGVAVIKECQQACKLHEINKALHHLKDVRHPDFV
jgi:MoaA/NifB/PqqE/SkfB family radical SAM enzyme